MVKSSAIESFLAADYTTDWVKVDIVPIFASIISRISTLVFLGRHDSSEEWLTITKEYTENLFKTGMLLRMLPKSLRPLIAPFLPTYRELRRNRKSAYHIIGKIVQSRMDAEAQQNHNFVKPNDILQWMMDLAVGDEKETSNLAQRMLILSLSSIHTTALTMTQALYDLIAHQEYIAPIETEVVTVLKENSGWSKATLNRFRKLDSLLKESQRFNPIFLGISFSYKQDPRATLTCQQSLSTVSYTAK